MDEHTRNYLASIGRKGGTRSRRALSETQARAMVDVREARRAERTLAAAPFGAMAAELPGYDLVVVGLRDLAAQRESDAALLVSMAAPRLRLLGVRITRVFVHPEDRLYDRMVDRYGDGAHSAYNALVRRIVSFSRAAASCGS
jgi:hypothetical protein